MQIKNIAVIATALISLGGWCAAFESTDSLAVIETKLKMKMESRSKLMRSNPKVIYAEENSPGMNIKKRCKAMTIILVL